MCCNEKKFFVSESLVRGLIDLTRHPDSPNCVRKAAAQLMVEIAHTVNHLMIDDPNFPIIPAEELHAYAEEGSW